MLSLNTYVRLCRLLDRLGIPLFGSLHYIGGSDTLPAPLAREEEARLLAALEGRTAGRRPAPGSSSTTSGWWSTSPGGLRTPGWASRI